MRGRDRAVGGGGIRGRERGGGRGEREGEMGN